jgi:hypothetical protein
MKPFSKRLDRDITSGFDSPLLNHLIITKGGMIKIVAIVLLAMYLVTLIAPVNANTGICRVYPECVTEEEFQEFQEFQDHTINVNMKVVEYGWDRKAKNAITYIPPEEGCEKFEYETWIFAVNMYDTDDEGNDILVSSSITTVKDGFANGATTIVIPEITNVKFGELIIDIPFVGPKIPPISRTTTTPINYGLDEDGNLVLPSEIAITVNAYRGVWTYFDPIVWFGY